jgi:hypothetical protein
MYRVAKLFIKGQVPNMKEQINSYAGCPVRIYYDASYYFMVI